MDYILLQGDSKLTMIDLAVSPWERMEASDLVVSFLFYPQMKIKIIFFV